jgi:hypothetical protein
MKSYSVKILTIALIAAIDSLKAQESFAPVDPLWVTPARDNYAKTEFSQDEVAAPAPGKITKRYLRDLRAFRADVARLHAYLTERGSVVNPLCITRCQALLNGVDVAIASENQSDAVMTWQLVLNAWPAMKWVAEPNELRQPDTHLEWIYDSFHNCVRDHAANMPDEIAAVFVSAFTERRFFPEREDWINNAEWRVFASDMWICNPSVTLEILKSINPEDAEEFATYGDLDEIYGQNSSAIPHFKARYAANREQICAKYADFKAWLSSVDAPPPSGEISKRDVIALKRESTRLGRLIELLEHGTVGKTHSLFPKLMAYKAEVDQLATSARISDIKEVILATLPFEREWLKIWLIKEGSGDDDAKEAAVAALGLPEFFYDVACLMGDSSMERIRRDDVPVLLVNLFDKCWNGMAGNSPAELFEYEYLWVAKPEDAVGDAVDVAADVFVLFPDQMSDRVKSLALTGRQRLLEYKGSLLDTPEKFFAVFTKDPGEHPNYVLTRYQANKAEVDAKFSALIQWHRSQPAGQ